MLVRSDVGSMDKSCLYFKVVVEVEVYPKSVDCHTPSHNLAFLNFDIFQNKLGLRVVCVFSSPNA